jgi:hypothetical protein
VVFTSGIVDEEPARSPAPLSTASSAGVEPGTSVDLAGSDTLLGPEESAVRQTSSSRGPQIVRSKAEKSRQLQNLIVDASICDSSSPGAVALSTAICIAVESL